jgi:hypothetical protein
LKIDSITASIFLTPPQWRKSTDFFDFLVRHGSNRYKWSLPEHRSDLSRLRRRQKIARRPPFLFHRRGSHEEIFFMFSKFQNYDILTADNNMGLL